MRFASTEAVCACGGKRVGCGIEHIASASSTITHSRCAAATQRLCRMLGVSADRCLALRALASRERLPSMQQPSARPLPARFGGRPSSSRRPSGCRRPPQSRDSPFGIRRTEPLRDFGYRMTDGCQCPSQAPQAPPDRGGHERQMRSSVVTQVARCSDGATFQSRFIAARRGAVSRHLA